MATRYLILSGLTVAEVFQHVSGNYSKVGEGKGMWGGRRRGRKKEGEEEGGGGRRRGRKKIEGSIKGGHYKFLFVLLQPSCTAYSVLMKYLNLVLFENENITSQAQWVSLVIDWKFTVILKSCHVLDCSWPSQVLLCHDLIALSTETVKDNNHQYMRLSSSQYFELNYTHTHTHTHTQLLPMADKILDFYAEQDPKQLTHLLLYSWLREYSTGTHTLVSSPDPSPKKWKEGLVF